MLGATHVHAGFVARILHCTQSDPKPKHENLRDLDQGSSHSEAEVPIASSRLCYEGDGVHHTLRARDDAGGLILSVHHGVLLEGE